MEGMMMTRTRLRRSVSFVIAALASVSFNQLSAQPKGGPTVANIILVHGAWADGSSWSRVIPLLEARHFHVIAVQLPLTSLSDDVAATKRAIARITTEHPGPVLLVGHSYGGVVIGEAGNDPHVVGLVYVAAFAPDHGESALSLLSSSQTPPPLGNHLVVDASGFFTIDRTGVEEDFAQCLPESERRILAVTQGPTSGAALTGAATSPAWHTKQSWFIVATRDRSIPPGLEEAMAARMGAQTTTLKTCHVAMLDMPFKVADVIADAASEK
jgi:pimeloyl-ACP methyl ester carboxylesterase